MELAGRIAAFAAEGPRGLCWLDGGAGEGGWLAAWPELELESDDFDDLRAVEALWREAPQRPWFGWLGYELGAARLLGRPGPRGKLPGIGMRRYAAALRIEARGALRVVGDVSAGQALLEAVAAPSAAAPRGWPWSPLVPELGAEAYRDMVERGQRYIEAGESYQLNLSQAFRARLAETWEAPRRLSALAAATYLELRARAPASMGALVDAGSAFIVSNSPETLLEVEAGEGRVVARSMPIKGTRPRDPDPRRDAALAAALLRSEKDLAEHVMIVDLVRNDLGRVGLPGSLRSAPTPTLVSLPTVHHLVTTVSCVLPSSWSLVGLLEAMFPGGSITGAPKRRSVELIGSLERGLREIYCGAVVALHPGGLQVSIPIRTALLDHDGLWLRAGGGVVMDSDPEAERQEAEDKTAAFDPERRPSRPSTVA